MPISRKKPSLLPLLLCTWKEYHFHMRHQSNTWEFSYLPTWVGRIKSALKLIGLLFRRFYKNAQPSTLLRLSFIRSHLEYCSASLPSQRHFAPWKCTKVWSSSYSVRLTCTAIRETFPGQVMSYVQNHAWWDWLPRSASGATSFFIQHRSDNTLSIVPYSCHLHNSFFPKTTTHWNSLPAHVVNQTSIVSFKHCLSKLT